MSAELKFISLNIERSKHLHRILPLLEREQPDVVCLQELLEHDIPVFERAYGPCRVFADEGLHPADPPEAGDVREGNGIFSSLPIVSSDVVYYAGSLESTRSGKSIMYLEDLSVGWGDFIKDDSVFRIATTHFTWTSHGDPNDIQRTNMASLLRTLQGIGEFVLSGDFNAPRTHRGEPGEIFGMIAEKYKDNIPSHYKTSIDVRLHRAGHLPEERMDEKMVDGLFSTLGYEVSDVRLVDGVSDHMAIVATIAKK